MKLKIIIFSFALMLLSATFCFSQTKTKTAPSGNLSNIKASPAFAELILRRTELESELEELLVSYTDEFPKVRDAKYEIGVLEREIQKILNVKPEESGKLTLALGKLMVRKAQLETEYWNLKNRFSEEHPQTKRAKRKLEIFDKSIKEII